MYDFGMRKARKFGLLTEVLLLTHLVLILFLSFRWAAYGAGYLFLAWNLFLAWAPVWFLYGFVWANKTGRNRAFKAGFLLSWLFFFPNAPYLLTDISHIALAHHHQTRFIEKVTYADRLLFAARPDVMLDAAILFLAALIGLILAIKSLTLLYSEVLGKYTVQKVAWVSLVISLLVGPAIYVGRILRWNSWDLIIKPHLLIAEFTSEVLLNPTNLKVLLIYTVIFMITTLMLCRVAYSATSKEY